MRQVLYISQFLDENRMFKPGATTEKPIAEKEILLHYLRSGKEIGACPAIVKDEITGEHLGGDLLLLTDGTYEWMSDIAYYFEKYNLRLPEDFVAHALAS